MKTAVCLLVFGVLGLATCSFQFSVDLEDEWSKYKVSYERSYEATEDGLRKIIFMNNLKTIMRHNIEADMGRHTYWMGVNQFTDMVGAAKFSADTMVYPKLYIPSWGGNTAGLIYW